LFQGSKYDIVLKTQTGVIQLVLHLSLRRQLVYQNSAILN